MRSQTKDVSVRTCSGITMELTLVQCTMTCFTVCGFYICISKMHHQMYFFAPYVSAHVRAADASFWKYCSRNGARGFRGKQSHLTKLMLWCGWKPPKWQQPSAPYWVVNLATAPRFSPSLIWNCHARTVIVLLCKMRFNLCAHISSSTSHIMIFAGSRKHGLNARAMTFLN